MTWTEIGKDHLAAAKLLTQAHPRSAASRAYYAVHVVLADVLQEAGYLPPMGRQTQPHEAQAGLIGRYVAASPHTIAELRRMVRRLYVRRLDADYRRTATVDAAAARDSVRDASAMFMAFGVR